MLFTDMDKKRMDKHKAKHNYKAYTPCWGLKCLLDFLVQFNVLPQKTPLQTWNFSGNSISFGRMPRIGVWVLCVFASTQNSEHQLQKLSWDMVWVRELHIYLGIFPINVIHLPPGKQILERCGFKRGIGCILV